MDIGYIALVLGVILISMTLHEALHGYAAYFLGDDTARLLGRLTLNPIKHIDPFLTLILPVVLALSGAPIFGGAKPVPFNPERLKYEEWGMAIVALAGPLTNLFIAFISFGVYVLVGMPASGLAYTVFTLLITVNLGFFIFNMIPLPPLDGSRVLYVLAPEFVRRGMEAIERYGVMLVFIIVLVASPLIGSFMTVSISFFLRLFAHIFGVA